MDKHASPTEPPKLGSSIGTPEFLRSAIDLTLDRLPVSDNAKRLIESLIANVVQWEGTRRKRARGPIGQAKVRDALSRIIGGLLRGWFGSPPLPVFQGRSKTHFSGRPVAYAQFTAVADALVAAGFLNVHLGVQTPGKVWDPGDVSWDRGWATRYWPTEALVLLGADCGIGPEMYPRDFRRDVKRSGKVRKISDPVRLMALKGFDGTAQRRRPVVEGDVVFAGLCEEVRAANDHAAAFQVSGCLPPQWHRVFAENWELGGRWTASGREGNYQLLPKQERLKITINSEPVTEIDVRASHLSIMHGLLGLPLPPGDLYDVPGLPRDVVKAWIVKTLGIGRPAKFFGRRGVPVPEALAGFDAKAVGRDICLKYPFLRAPAANAADAAGLRQMSQIANPARLLTHRLMALEAQAMSVLVKLSLGWNGRTDLLVLPVHDSLIVPKRFVAEIRQAIPEAFRVKAGVKVNTTSSSA